MIINKKIEQLRNKKEDQNLKSISFTIITGTGSHSVGHKPGDILKGKKKKDQDIVGDILEKVMCPPENIKI